MLHPKSSDPSTNIRLRIRLGANFPYLMGNIRIFGILLLLVIAFGIVAPGFLTVVSAQSILVSTALFLLLALGETMVIISGGIDLSIGSMLALSGMISGVVMSHFYHTGQGIMLSVIGLAVALAVGLCGGMINGIVIAKLRLNPLIVTLGTMGIFLGIAELISNGLPIANFPPFLFAVGNNGFGLPWLLWMTIVTVIVYGIVLSWTRFGRYVYAYGASNDSVIRAGVNTAMHTTWLYGLAGLGAGLAGYLSTAHFETASPVAGSQYLLVAVAAAVIGGTTLQGGEGSIGGTVIGALIISVLENGFVIMGLASFWQLVAVGAMVIVAVFFNDIQRRRKITAVGRTSPAGEN